MTADDRVSRCDAWLARGVEQVLNANILDKLDSLRYLKALCEIGFFVALRPDAYSSSLVQATRESLEAAWAAGRLLSVARHNLQHANLFVPLLWACRELLELTPRQRVDIRRIARLALRHTKERIPFREVDLHYVCMKIDARRHGFEQIQQFAALGCLRRGAAADCVSAQDDYAVTHTVFYLTDFGRLPWPQAKSLAPPDAIDSILETLRCLPGNSANLDLRGEFLLCRRYIGTPQEFVQRELEQVIAAQNDEGWWAGPVDLSRKLDEEAIPGEHWHFMLNYHTTLVCREAVAAWVACPAKHAAIASSGRPPGPGKHREPGAAVGRHRIAPTGSVEEQAAEAFSRMLHSPAEPVDLSLLHDPRTIVDFADLALHASLRGGLPADCSRILATYVRELEQHIDTNDRVRRISLVLQAAVEGRKGLQGRSRQIIEWFNRFRPDLFHALSADQCHVIALGLWSGALRNEDARAAEFAIRLALGRAVGAQNVSAAGQIVFISAIAGIHCDFDTLQPFFDSLRAASLPYGYLDPRDPESPAHGARLKIAAVRMSMARRRMLAHANQPDSPAGMPAGTTRVEPVCAMQFG